MSCLRHRTVMALKKVARHHGVIGLEFEFRSRSVRIFGHKLPDHRAKGLAGRGLGDVQTRLGPVTVVQNLLPRVCQRNR